MVIAFIGHVAGTIMMIFAKNYEMLYMGTLVLALANGAVEAVINPVTATIFPTKKTHYLNILHAGWPRRIGLGRGHCDSHGRYRLAVEGGLGADPNRDLWHHASGPAFPGAGSESRLVSPTRT